MKYKCTNCGKGYSGENIPLDKRCKKCNSLLKPDVINKVLESELSGESKKNNEDTLIKVSEENDNEKSNAKSVIHKNDIQISNNKRMYTSPFDRKQDDAVKVKEDEPQMLSSLHTMKSENESKNESRNERDVNTEPEVDAEFLEGELVESDSTKETYRNFLIKIRDGIKYGQCFSNTANRLIIRTKSGKRVAITFYGDVPYGSNYFKKSDQIKAKGRYNSNNEFIAKAIQVNGIWVKITNDSMRRTGKAQDWSLGRILSRMFLFLLALFVVVSIAKKVIYMGLNNFFIFYFIIGIGACYLSTIFHNMIFGRPSDRNRRWGLIAGLIILCILMIF